MRFLTGWIVGQRKISIRDFYDLKWPKNGYNSVQKMFVNRGWIDNGKFYWFIYHFIKPSLIILHIFQREVVPFPNFLILDMEHSVELIRTQSYSRKGQSISTLLNQIVDDFTSQEWEDGSCLIVDEDDKENKLKQSLHC